MIGLAALSLGVGPVWRATFPVHTVHGVRELLGDPHWHRGLLVFTGLYVLFGG